MKLADIKIEALKIMFVSYGERITAETLSSYETDENFASYLVKMNGAINRCFGDLEAKGIIPDKCHKLTADNGKTRGRYMDFDTKALNVGAISRVAYENMMGRRISDFDRWEYVPEEDKIILPVIREDEYYLLSYKPRMQRLTASSLDSMELDLPDYIAELIPYFIKGELYREDEPNEAGEARNYYEAATEQLMLPKDVRGSVYSKYSLCEV